VRRAREEGKREEGEKGCQLYSTFLPFKLLYLPSLPPFYTPESGKSLSWFPTVVRYRVLPAIGEIMFKKKSHTAMYPVA
jgi:hypothetical protein